MILELSKNRYALGMIMMAINITLYFFFHLFITNEINGKCKYRTITNVELINTEFNKKRYKAPKKKCMFPFAMP